eukprot:CAMPEP_0206260162 /NCGR_PEP_ID=MMETSP0047_2-20121206/26925_1 /ASSEMBLY_ACC=CAM_ASM_000192 /TAXON_ID=195065 /ORGANISM="Chroomonas mesostigmatica_cf, Strain CCMP1168" /LENGTH=41 /DNA_ID= /DNA_START= /DNA_END= /DNA_ORIENTATION=
MGKRMPVRRGNGLSPAFVLFVALVVVSLLSSLLIFSQHPHP